MKKILFLLIGIGIYLITAVQVNNIQNKTVFFNFNETSKSGIQVKVSAREGVFPIGTTMHVHDASQSITKDVANKVSNYDVCSAQGIDISFYNAQGIEIEPNGYVNVQIKLANPLKGSDFALIHVPDDSDPEYVGKGTATGTTFIADSFSLYVIAGLGTENDPISNIYREYTIGFGESITLLSDERNHNGYWIPGVQEAGRLAWETADISGGSVDQLATFQRYRGTKDVQPRLIVTAKNKTGTVRVAFRYTHPEDRTHKTLTGEFTATHYYLIHIVDKSRKSFNVQFRNNDGTGVSRVKESDLLYTTEEGVVAKRSVNNSNYTHTFTIENDPSTRAGKVTLIMPEYPGNTTRTSNGKTYQFIGWSTSAKANATDINTSISPIVYPHPDAHVFAPGDRFALDRDLTLWAIWALKDVMPAYFFIRIDDHIPNEPQSHGNASYTQIGKDINYKLPYALFEKNFINGIDQNWDASKRQKPWPAKVFSDLKAAGKLPDDITNVQDFNARYRIVWSTLKKENEAWHVDGILYNKALYNLAYHENGDLVVVSSMPEGVKDIDKGDSTLIDTRIPNRYDMVFTGWNTRADGTGTSYVPGTAVVVSEHPEIDTSINTLHLYAQWIKSTKYRYKVRYLEAETNKVLKDSIVYGDQILGNRIYSKDESDKATSDIEDYVFSYADPNINGNKDHIVIEKDNNKNIITLYYMPIEQEILATVLFIKKTDENGNPLADAKFELTRNNDNRKKEFISDHEGIVQIPFIEDPGPNDSDIYTYTLTENEAPKNHEKSDDTFSIQIKRGKPQVKTFVGGISKTVYPLEATVMKNGLPINSDNITVINKFIPDVKPSMFTVTYKLNGGTYNNSESDIVKTYPYNSKISMHDAPKREGYKFLYWKGSKYQPGDQYTVTGNKTFVAEWEYIENTKKPQSDDDIVTPQTSDNVTINISALLLSLLGIASIVIFNRKKVNK